MLDDSAVRLLDDDESPEPERRPVPKPFLVRAALSLVIGAIALGLPVSLLVLLYWYVGSVWFAIIVGGALVLVVGGVLVFLRELRAESAAFEKLATKIQKRQISADSLRINGQVPTWVELRQQFRSDYRREYRQLLDRVMSFGVPRFTLSVFPGLWHYLGFVLPRSLRLRVYEPSHQELLQDYLNVSRIRTKWVRRWLALCFTIRTVITIVDCLRVWWVEQIAKLIPAQLRAWWPQG
jgi:hypothetical protein